MKDNTAEVRVQVPVDVATFLLNEKRAELFGLEERLDVCVLLIPNIHLENPHYSVTRVRTDNVEENTVPSYHQVQEPENIGELPFSIGQNKPVKPEAAVKGIHHTQPAPVIEKTTAGKTESAGMWKKLTGWLGNLLGGKAVESATADRAAAEKTVKTTHQKKNQKSQTQERRQARAGRLAKNNNSAQKAQTVNEAKTPADSALTNRSASENRNRREEKRADRYANAQSDMSADAAQEKSSFKQEQNTSRRRRQRTSGKNDTPVQNVNTISVTDGVQVNDPLIITLADTESKNERHKTRHDKNSRRQNGKKKRSYIISARKISRNIDIRTITAQIQLTAEHVLNPEKKLNSIAAPYSEPIPETDDMMVQQAVALVEQAIARVLAQPEQALQTAAVDKAIVVDTEAVTRTRESDITSSEAAVTEAVADINLSHIARQGGLILVETNADKAVFTTNAIDTVQEQPKLRRKDIVPDKADNTIITPAALEQIETRI